MTSTCDRMASMKLTNLLAKHHLEIRRKLSADETYTFVAVEPKTNSIFIAPFTLSEFPDFEVPDDLQSPFMVHRGNLQPEQISHTTNADILVCIQFKR